MDPRFRHGILILTLLALPAGAAAQATDSLPSGVTRAMVEKGKALYGGAGLCLACHGVDGKGTIGPSLVDQEWLHGDGSYDWLVRQIQTGVDARASKTGQIMPPRGGSGLKDDDVRAVAAYVWALNRGVKVR